MPTGDALATPLLAADEPPPVVVEGEARGGPTVVVCEHAGRRIPRALDDLGLPREALDRHFMWVIGALPLARAVAERLDAPLVHQPFSRMVCDCNRPVDVPSFAPDSGEGLPVPGNVGLTAQDRAARAEAIWKPFHDRLARLLAGRKAHGVPTALLAIHTFTPVFFGVPRSVLAGVLFDRDAAFAPALLAALAQGDPRIAANEPYRIERDGDWTIPFHGEDGGIPCALVEVRNDLLSSEAGVAVWADRIAAATRAALTAAGIDPSGGRTRLEREGLSG